MENAGMRIVLTLLIYQYTLFHMDVMMRSVDCHALLLSFR